MGALEHHYNGNNNNGGNGVTWRWLVGVLGSAFVVIGGWAWASTTARVLELEKASNANALGVVRIQSETESSKARLERIEQKLDEVLDNSRFTR